VKKLIVGLLTLVFLIGCAAPDRSAELGRVAQFGWVKLRDAVDSYTAYDTLAFDLRHYRGAVTYWIDPDTSSATSAANLPDSCMTIYLELYSDESGEWGKYYSTVTKLDTIDRAAINVAAADADVYIPLAKFNADQFGWADRARIIEYVGVGNKHGGGRWVGGQ
jgi:hypothetical protein